MTYEHSDAYHNCINLQEHFQNSRWAVSFPKALCFIFVLSSQCLSCPEEYAQTAQNCPFSLQNYSFFWNGMHWKNSGLRQQSLLTSMKQKLALDGKLLTDVQLVKGVRRMGNQPYIIAAVASPICIGISHYLYKVFAFALQLPMHQLPIALV